MLLDIETVARHHQISHHLPTRRSQVPRHSLERLLASRCQLTSHLHTLSKSRMSELSIFQLQTLDLNLPRLFALPARYYYWFSYDYYWRESIYLTCIFFQASVTTTTSSRPSMMAWAASCVLCFTMLWPCFCVPFCVDSFKDVKHSCPNCNVTLGRYKGCI